MADKKTKKVKKVKRRNRQQSSNNQRQAITINLNKVDVQKPIRRNNRRPSVKKMLSLQPPSVLQKTIYTDTSPNLDHLSRIVGDKIRDLVPHQQNVRVVAPRLTDGDMSPFDEMIVRRSQIEEGKRHLLIEGPKFDNQMIEGEGRPMIEAPPVMYSKPKSSYKGRSSQFGETLELAGTDIFRPANSAPVGSFRIEAPPIQVPLDVSRSPTHDPTIGRDTAYDNLTDIVEGGKVDYEGPTVVPLTTEPYDVEETIATSDRQVPQPPALLRNIGKPTDVLGEEPQKKYRLRGRIRDLGPILG